MLRFPPLAALALACLVLSTPASAERVALDLNGFRLWQLKTAVRAALGEPFQTIDGEDVNYEAHAAGESYMVFGYPKDRPNNIASIQITGPHASMTPFFGLKLGDDTSAVRKALGEPDSKTRVDDPRVTLLGYGDSNFSVELDERGKLYSIRIHVTEQIMRDASKDSGQSAWSEFESAVLAGDMNRVRRRLRPDIEIYRDGKILRIERPYADHVQNPDAALVSALVGENQSVRQELMKTAPEFEIRILEGVGVGQVYKFHQGEILEEIVFFPYGGLYRVYEIQFRSGGRASPANAAD